MANRSRESAAYALACRVSVTLQPASGLALMATAPPMRSKALCVSASPRPSPSNYRVLCSRFDLSSTTRIEEFPASSANLDPELSLTNTSVLQGSLSRDAQGLRSLVFSDALTQSETRFDPSRSLRTSVQLTLRDQPSP